MRWLIFYKNSGSLHIKFYLYILQSVLHITANKTNKILYFHMYFIICYAFKQVFVRAQSQYCIFICILLYNYMCIHYKFTHGMHIYVNGIKQCCHVSECVITGIHQNKMFKCLSLFC